MLSSDIDTFLAGGFLEVCEFDRKERKKNRAPDEVVNYARSKLGMRGPYPPFRDFSSAISYFLFYVINNVTDGLEIGKADVVKADAKKFLDSDNNV